MLRLSSFFTSGYHNSKWVYITLFLLILLLTNSRQAKNTNFACEICSDKAGYYMYLPAVLHMGFEAKNYPKDFDHAHGDGFHLENGKVITKFTCGIALLQAPFYIAGALVAKTFSLDVLPYSNYYMFFINIGAVFYLVLGLYFLRKWLNYYVDDISSFWTILVLFFGTNLYYYTIDESLMSHMYSFSLFSILLYALKTFFETKKFNYFLLFIIPLSFAILIRPTNILFAPFALMIDVNRLDVLKSKLILLLRPKYLISAAFIFFLIISPQMFYWKFAFDKYLVWSYVGESFSYWDDPQFAIVWFSPQSGLFTYTPIVLLSLAFGVVMFIKKEPNALLVFCSFFIVSYLCAAWSNPYFGGCNFGKRPMVEYLPLLMFPIAYLFEYSKSYSIKLRYILLAATLLLAYYNYALFTIFDTCFFGDTWDWKTFGLLLYKIFF